MAGTLLAGWLVGWLAGWLHGCSLAGWLAGKWPAGWINYLQATFRQSSPLSVSVMESPCVGAAIRHQFQELPPPHTSDANPGNPTGPTGPTQAVGTPPLANLDVARAIFTTMYDIILELFQWGWPLDTGHLDQKSRLYYTRFVCLGAWCWVGENFGLTSINFPKDVLTRIRQ